MTQQTSTEPSLRAWRTVDIVVAAVVAAAFGVVFWAWNFVWTATGPAFTAFPPLQYLISGVWLMPAVLVPLIVRKPGAALFAEVVAASTSALLGSVWGLDTLLSGFAQGAAAELVFAFTLYRVWSLPVAVAAGLAAAVGEWLHDIPLYWPAAAPEFQLAIGAFMLASGALIAGVGGWLLVRALVQTGVLQPFSAGRSQRAV